jgi:hypothetical protein
MVGLCDSSATRGGRRQFATQCGSRGRGGGCGEVKTGKEGGGGITKMKREAELAQAEVKDGGGEGERN